MQYGSDALGGTVHFLSGAVIASRRAAPVGGSVSITGATANEAVTGRADLGIQAGRASVRFGGSRMDVGDLRAGDGLDSHAAVTRFLGLPSTVVGDTLPSTGFEQSGGYLVASANAGRNATIRGSYLHENQTGASRYDRILGGEGLFRSGFDPQTLDFGVLRYEVPDVAGLDGVSVAFSVNRQADGRFEQARPGVRLDRQSSATTALGYQGQVHKSLGSRQRFVAGTEFYDEAISAERQLVDPTITTAARPDIPDGTAYSSFGAFGQHTADVMPNRLTLVGGLRANAFRFSTATDPVLGVVEENVSSNDVTFQSCGRRPRGGQPQRDGQRHARVPRAQRGRPGQHRPDRRRRFRDHAEPCRRAGRSGRHDRSSRRSFHRQFAGGAAARGGVSVPSWVSRVRPARSTPP